MPGVPASAPRDKRTKEELVQALAESQMMAAGLAMRNGGLELELELTKTRERGLLEDIATIEQQLASGMVLSPENPFEAVVMTLVGINRSKSADYASPDNMLLNFDRVAAMLDLEGFNPTEDLLQEIAKKFQRIVNLRGRHARNETVADSYNDLAVYAILAIVNQRRLGAYGEADLIGVAMTAGDTDDEVEVQL